MRLLFLVVVMTYKKRILECLFARSRAISIKCEEKTNGHPINLENTQKEVDFVRGGMNFDGSHSHAAVHSPKNIKQETQEMDDGKTVVATTPLPNDKAVFFTVCDVRVYGFPQCFRGRDGNFRRFPFLSSFPGRWCGGNGHRATPLELTPAH
jgi:hypothetical protein